jgi:RimJ/RimL family protein N-acetyltransferase
MRSVFAENTAAITCYKTVGFRESRRRREYVFKDGKYIDKIFIDILENEFVK